MFGISKLFVSPTGWDGRKYTWSSKLFVSSGRLRFGPTIQGMAGRILIWSSKLFDPRDYTHTLVRWQAEMPGVACCFVYSNLFLCASCGEMGLRDSNSHSIACFECITASVVLV